MRGTGLLSIPRVTRPHSLMYTLGPYSLMSIPNPYDVLYDI